MYIFYFALTAIMILADYFSKVAAVEYLKPGHTTPLIKNIFHLTYCENTGGAFSIFEGNPYILAVISLVLIGALITYIAMKKPKNHVLMCSLSMIVAGGLGNIIDRVTKGFVVDFFDFCAINFAIFNVADIFVCCGMALLAYYIIFIQDKAEKGKKK